MKKLLCLIAFVCLFARPVLGKDIPAVSCNRADVESAAKLLMPGDRLLWPAGTCHYTEGLTLTVPANVEIVGAGVPSTYGNNGVTVIVDDIPRGYDAGLLEIVTDCSGTFRMTGLTFNGTTASYNGHIRIYGCSKKFRVDHNNFDGMTYVNLLVAGDLWGVVDHNKVNLPGGSNIFTRVNGIGDYAWSQPTDLGTDKFVFIEDNQIDHPGFGAINDGYEGARYVIRYNKSQNAGCQTHPTGGSGRARGTRAFEVYKNVFTSTTTNFNLCFISSGAGVIWGNEAPSGFTHFITLHSMRVDTKTYTQAPFPQGWGQCPSPFDVNGCALDQPGKGKSDLLSGAFPNVKNETKGCIVSDTCKPDQTTDGFYEWQNVWATAGGGQKIAVYEPSAMIVGRDYFPDTPKPGYVAFTYPHPLVGGVTPPVPTVPVPPVSAIISMATDTTLNLAWNDNSTNEDLFRIERCQGTGCTAFVSIATVPANVLSRTDSGLMPATLYRYRVRAENTAGNSAYSNITEGMTTTPIPPNMPPLLTSFQLKNGSVVLDPAIPITVKNVTIAALFSDDIGVERAELFIKGQSVKVAFGVLSLSYTWNTQPYRGKGSIDVEIVLRDVEGLETRKKLTVTVKK